jgi:hypothetical protein
MATTVEITLGDDGAFAVGLVDAPAADADSQQQAGSIDEALSMAKHLLENPEQGAGADDMADGSEGAPSAAAGPAPGAEQGAPMGAGNGPAAGSDSKQIWDELAAQGPAH